MSEHLSPGRALLLGLFVIITLVLGVGGVFLIGQHDWIFASTFTVDAKFPTIGGVGTGTRVRLQGIDAGVVEHIEPPSGPGEPVRLRLRINETYRPLIRTDAVVTLVTEGIVGSRVVEIHPGSQAAAPIKPGAELKALPPVELSQILAEAYSTGQELRSLGRQLSGIVDRMDRLAMHVEDGQGSLGKFVMTDDAHRAALELMDAGGHLVTTLDESVLAMRRVWPLKDYFQQQGMNQPDDLLYRPKLRRESHTLPTAELFPPGRSVLSEAGKSVLDTQAAWIKSAATDETEIVIACFDQTETSNTKAQRLTQEQADAVLSYLRDVHAIQRVGFFGRRTCTAAGFGNVTPDGQEAGALAKRVELILFLPEK